MPMPSSLSPILWVPVLWISILWISACCISCIDALEASGASNRIRVDYGSFVIPASPIHTMQTFQIPTAMPCTSCVIINGEVLLTYEDGTPVGSSAGLWLQHIAFSCSGRYCTVKPWLAQKQPLFLVGNALMVLDLPEDRDGSPGYRVPENESLLIAGGFVNISPQTATITLSVNWEYFCAPGDGGTTHISANPLMRVDSVSSSSWWIMDILLLILCLATLVTFAYVATDAPRSPGTHLPRWVFGRNGKLVQDVESLEPGLASDEKKGLLDGSQPASGARR